MTRFVLVVILCLLCQCADARKRRAGWGRRRRRWIDWGAIDRARRAADAAARAAIDRARRAADRAARAALDRARRAAEAARRAADRAARAAAEAARRAADRVKRAAIAAAEAAKRAALAAAKFLQESFGGLVECITDLKKCILALINAVFKGLGLPNPISNPHGWKFCLRPQGMCVTLPSPSLKTPPWKWGASLHCVDVLMMVDYWMSFCQAIFNAIMGAISWFLDKLCKVANAIIDFINQAFKAVAKVFEPLLSPVIKLFKPLADAIKAISVKIGNFFSNIFGRLNLFNLFSFPRISFPSWNFLKNGCFEQVQFGMGLDTCGIKEIYDSLTAAFCALKSLDFDKFLKSIKAGIQAVINFGKNIGKCFKVSSVGLASVFDAFPFVSVHDDTKCSGSMLAGFLATIAFLISVAATAIYNAFQWLVNGLKGLGGALSSTRRSNRSGKGDHSTNVYGIKSALSKRVQEVPNLWKKLKSAKVSPVEEVAKLDRKSFNAYAKSKAELEMGSTSVSSKIKGAVSSGLQALHIVAIGLNFLFAFLASLAPVGGFKIVAFLVFKFVIVVCAEKGVGTFTDLQFAIFYGTVLAFPLLSTAMEALKKLSPFQSQDPALGISWTGDQLGGCKYCTNKADPKKPSARGKDNAVFLQALSINPKIELGWPAYAGRKWGMTVPIEFKPIWLMWFWSFESNTFNWKLALPITDMQIEYDLVVYLPDAEAAVKAFFNQNEHGENDGLYNSLKGLTDAARENVGATGNDIHMDDTWKQQYKNQFDQTSSDAKAAKAEHPKARKEAEFNKEQGFFKKVQKYIEVYFMGIYEVTVSFFDMFKGGVYGFLAQLMARLALALMFLGWVFAVCCTCKNHPQTR